MTRGNRYTYLLVALFLATGLAAQNLVPNPGFEAFDRCPPYLGQIHESSAWDSPNNNTTDYFHRCSPPADGAGVPLNQLGRQDPAEGDGYAGIRLWIPVIPGNPVYREYLAVRLLEPLRAGLTYDVRFLVSLAESSSHATDGIGLFLSVAPPGNERLYPVVPQVANPPGRLLDDTEGWTAIEGTYRAKGGEAYLIIGNFQSDSSMVRQVVASGEAPKVYYYVDQVRVEPCLVPEDQFLVVDTAVCRGEALRLEGDPTARSWRWANGSDTFFRQVAEPGTYRVSSDLGCFVREWTFRVRAVECDCRTRLPNPLILRPGYGLSPTLPEGMEPRSVVIFDPLGRLVRTYRDRLPGAGELRALASGVYFFQMDFFCRLPGGTEARSRQVGKMVLVW